MSSEIQIGDRVRLTAAARKLGIRLTRNDTATTPAWGIVAGFGREGICLVRAHGGNSQRTRYAISALEKVAASDEEAKGAGA